MASQIFCCHVKDVYVLCNQTDLTQSWGLFSVPVLCPAMFTQATKSVTCGDRFCYLRSKSRCTLGPLAPWQTEPWAN